jgi:Leucine-rich repeat (LRR) protein
VPLTKPDLESMMAGEPAEYDETLVEGFKAFFALMGPDPAALKKLELERFDEWKGTGLQYPPANLKGIERCTRLKTLLVEGIGLTEIAPIAALTTLTSLDIQDNPINDLTPLSTLGKLKRLSLTNLSYEDLTPLAKLTKLQKLWLSNTTTVSDISPLASCTALEFLSLGGTCVKDLTPIKDLSKLTELILRSTEKLVVEKGNANYTIITSLMKRGVEVYVEKPALTNTWTYDSRGKRKRGRVAV